MGPGHLWTQALPREDATFTDYTTKFYVIVTLINVKRGIFQLYSWREQQIIM